MACWRVTVWADGERQRARRRYWITVSDTSEERAVRKAIRLAAEITGATEASLVVRAEWLHESDAEHPPGQRPASRPFFPMYRPRVG